ncbi:MAG TPA: chemotaxis protein CheA [Candidatus Dormibacteraeota bacterium]|nr:chemotaxis protein CheA [Candidatus Dormibacteraeota bacterium]
MDFDREKVVAAFLAESEEGLERTEQHLIAAETDPGNLELLDEMFRVAHTIKGNASALDFPELAGFAHVMEDLLEALRKNEVAISREVISLLLHGVDALRSLVPAAAEGNDRLSPSHLELKKAIASHASGRQTATRAAALGSDPLSSPTVASPTAGPGAASLGARARTLRVDTDKLDHMLNLTGEIAIAQGRLRLLIEDLKSDSGRKLLEVHREIESLQKNLQEQVMGVRLVPVGPLFQQFARSVRDISQSHNKLARLQIVGADVEVDTRVLEHLKDPLLHMIRNAVDHGIEAPRVRHSLGKPPCGSLTLTAFHRAGNILIQLSDDGAGFNRQRILAKARALDLLPEGEKVSDQELFNLVFKAGFTTADAVTDLSGRGVGMDVVRRNIELLRGNIEIQSTEGQGSTITIRLPLTLAIIDGFSVAANNETYVIPLETISECLALPQDQISSEAVGVLSLRGEPLPYVRLREVFGKPGRRPERENVVVIHHDGGYAGIAVETLLGECQAIIKPLNRIFRDVPGVSGSTILDNGRVALILDVSTLLREVIAEQAQAVN